MSLGIKNEKGEVDANRLSAILKDDASFTDYFMTLPASYQRDLYTQFLTSGKDLRKTSFQFNPMFSGLRSNTP